jgi:hypothetical protein
VPALTRDSPRRASGRSVPIDDPAAVVPALTRGLTAARERTKRSRSTIRQQSCRRSRADSPQTREAIKQFAADNDAAYSLALEEQQFVDAINSALGLEFTAIARPGGMSEAPGAGAGEGAAT